MSTRGGTHLLRKCCEGIRVESRGLRRRSYLGGHFRRMFGAGLRFLSGQRLDRARIAIGFASEGQFG